MKLKDFKLERYFAEYEFSAKYLLSSSDCENISLKDLTGLADRECLGLWENLRFGYTETEGHPLLRKEIAYLYDQISSDDIIVVVPEEGIFIALNSLLDKGDHVIVIDPAYQSLSEIAISIGCSITRWPVVLKNNKWFLDLKFLKKNISSKTKLIIINFPHNPTGYLPAEEEYLEVFKIAKINDCYVFSDEMYRFLEFDPSSSLPPACDIYEKGISLFGLSKTFGLPGLRIGWLCAKNKTLLDSFTSFKDYTTICNNAAGEILGIIALRNKNQIINNNLKIIKTNLQNIKKICLKYTDLFCWYEPQGSSVTFPALNKNIKVEKFCRDLMIKRNIMLLPGSIFNFTGNHFRIGLGKKNLKEGLNKFEEYLNDFYPNK